MPLSPEDLGHVRSSLDHLRVNFAAHSTKLYEALFARAPELREMFRDDLAGQGMKFLSTLDAIVQKLDSGEGPDQDFLDLSKMHASLGVTRKDFAPMEEAVLETLREGMGDRYSPELEAAWRAAFEEVSANMIESGGIGD